MLNKRIVGIFLVVIDEDKENEYYVIFILTSEEEKNALNVIFHGSF